MKMTSAGNFTLASLLALALPLAAADDLNRRLAAA